MSFSIVIPAFNEEQSIGTVLTQIQEEFADAEIIVVDDRSTDHTSDVVQSFERVRYILHAVNSGPIVAIMTGIKNASYDIVVTLDADGQHPVKDISRLIDPIKSKKADIVLGVRNTLPRMGEKVIARATGVTDATTGFRAMKKELVELFEGEFAYGGMFLLRAKKKGYSVLEVPITVRERIAGFSVHSGMNIFIKSLKFFWWSVSSQELY